MWVETVGQYYIVDIYVVIFPPNSVKSSNPLFENHWIPRKVMVDDCIHELHI